MMKILPTQFFGKHFIDCNREAQIVYHIIFRLIFFNWYFLAQNPGIEYHSFSSVYYDLQYFYSSQSSKIHLSLNSFKIIWCFSVFKHNSIWVNYLNKLYNIIFACICFSKILIKANRKVPTIFFSILLSILILQTKKLFSKSIQKLRHHFCSIGRCWTGVSISVPAWCEVSVKVLRYICLHI